MTLTEGKNREIRRMCEAVGLEVIRLKRLAVGPVRLGMLQPGEYRELKKEEIAACCAAAARKTINDNFRPGCSPRADFLILFCKLAPGKTACAKAGKGPGNRPENRIITRN